MANKWKPTEATPCNLSKYTPKIRNTIINADFYVSPHRSSEGSFYTLEGARDAIRELRRQGDSRHINVALMPGEYRRINNTFELTDEDINTTYTAYNNEPVVFTGGIRFNNCDFMPADDTFSERFPDKDKIYFVELKKYGITEEMLGGTVEAEVFENGIRLKKPTYPLSGWAKTGKVISGEKNKAGAFAVLPEDAENILKWQSLNSVKLEGYFAVDWSFSSLDVMDWDENTRVIYTSKTDCYGIEENCNYKFVNIPEMFISPGQYMINNGKLYVYPSANIGSANLEISLSEEPFVKLNGAENITFDGITFRLSRSCGIAAVANNITVKSCIFNDIYEKAVYAVGTRNNILECEVCHMATSGVQLIAGDKPTLTPGYGVVDNCLFHDIGEVIRSGVEGASIVGVHNRISHCEFYNTPFRAIHYSGQDHIIEYNYAHEVVLGTGDMGVTYSGYHWESQGCVLRYNCFCNVGTAEHPSNGIYWDDMLGGQTGYGNIIINCGGHGFIIGGGRDHLNYNNIVLNAGGYSLLYDQRGLDWERDHSINFDTGIWANLKSVPYTSDKWRDKFPSLAKVITTPDWDDPNFPPTPANSRIFGNIYISRENYHVHDAVKRFSNIGNNCAFELDDEIGFIDRANGDYRLREDSPVYDKIPAFENLPFEKMGRY